MSEDRIVYVERRTSGAYLSYHREGSLPSTVGMEAVTEQEAREGGAVQCSHCWSDQNVIQYLFPYWCDES